MHVEHPLARAGRGGVRLRECAEWPLALPDRDTGGRQMLERFLVRSSVRLRPVIESNSFEFLRSCLDDRETLSFQIAIGALSGRPDLAARVVDDAGFPRGDLVLAHLAGRQLPPIAHAFAEAVGKAMARPAAARPA
jgi:DNA-binding transcriptional LysR family regulator